MDQFNIKLLKYLMWKFLFNLPVKKPFTEIWLWIKRKQSCRSERGTEPPYEVYVHVVVIQTYVNSFLYMLLYFLPLNYCDIQSPEKHEHAVITNTTIKNPCAHNKYEK